MKIFCKINTAILIFAVLCSVVAFPVSAAIGQTNYVIDSRGKSTLPLCYVPKKRIDSVKSGSFFNAPKNIYVDKADNLYVADSGNNRIVKFNSELEYICEFTAGKSLKQPNGMYYDSAKKELYIADTDNGRIVVVNDNDKVLREYFKPQSELLDEDTTFNPSNISIGIQGYMYILKGQYFMQMNQEGEFKGYVGSTKVGASLISLLVRKFASKKQKEQLVSEQPSPYLNFTMDNNGVIYAVASTDSSQIRKINMVGDNLYAENFFGEMVQDVSGKTTRPNFISVAVSDDGIISVLEENSKKIYQYSQTGEMLNVFGGEGEVAGFFTTPVSIAVNSAGSVYVVDGSQNAIQMFERTSFASLVYKAQEEYNAGNYKESYKLYEDAKKINPNYSILNKGRADCLYRMGKTQDAAKAYLMADNREGYGIVQAERRQEFMKNHFGIVCLIVIAVFVTVVLLIKALRSYADKLISRFYHLDD